MWFGQKGPLKVENFRLLTAHLKFHQICTLIGLFRWKNIKSPLKKYRGVMSHDTKEWYKIWRKNDLLFQKWQEYGEFWPEHLKFTKFPLWWLILCKVYNVWPKRCSGGMIHDTEGWFKTWKKSGLWFGKWHHEFGKCFATALKSLKIGPLIGSFYPK